MENVWKLFEGWRRFDRDQYNVMSDPFYGPPPLINDVIDCWAQEGIRFFNETHNANGMSYHVMLPTDELEFHIERNLSRNSYSHLARELVERGAPMTAIRIKVGKNGRAVIDRDAEIIVAAKQVGLAQLPVLFSFQDEV
jgi:hypothetical protein